MRTVSVVIAFLLFASSAEAEVINKYCSGKRGARSCTTIFSGGGESGNSKIMEAGVIHQPDEKAWRAFCRPHTVQDRFGVERFVYAHPGCEFGRSR